MVVLTMSTYSWCHGPNCHTYSTQDRVRGSKGSKVLRTRKIRRDNPNYVSLYSFFCSNGCYNDFAHKHADAIRRIEPRNEPLETPCEVTTETHQDWHGHDYTRKIVEKINQ